MPAAGRLRFQIAIEKPSGTLTDGGEEDGVWIPVTTLAAEIKPLKGRELELERQMFADVTHLVTTRVPSVAIDPTMRVKWHDNRLDVDRIFNILSAINVMERGAELQMDCKEIVG